MVSHEGTRQEHRVDALDPGPGNAHAKGQVAHALSLHSWPHWLRCRQRSDRRHILGFHLAHTLGIRFDYQRGIPLGLTSDSCSDICLPRYSCSCEFGSQSYG